LAKQTIDEAIEDVIRDENPTSRAVKTLIEVNDRTTGKFGTDIELKTDLDKNQICVHTAASMLNSVLEMDKDKFNKECILGNLIEVKERKLLSKDRKSRVEIVDIARQPDMNFGDGQNQNFVSRFFSSRKERPQQNLR